MAQFPTPTNANGLWTIKKVNRNIQGGNWPALPGAPTGVTATAASAQATVTFTAPAVTGGTITSYTVTSSPGSITASGASSPITVTGLTNGTAYTFTVRATNATGTGPASSPSNSVTPTAVVVWNEAGTGSTTTALKSNLLYAGVGNTVYQWANVATLVQADTNPKSTSGLSVPGNYSVGNSYVANSTHGMTTGPTIFSSTNGYGTNTFRTAKVSAPNLRSAWGGSPNPGIACFWFYVGDDGMHWIGNADCTTRYLLDAHPTNSAWNWIVVDLYNNVRYYNGTNQGSAGGTYSNLYCGFYMGWTNSNTIDGYYHDYRVYQYSAANHTAMVNALVPTPGTSYYSGGL